MAPSPAGRNPQNRWYVMPAVFQVLGAKLKPSWSRRRGCFHADIVSLYNSCSHKLLYCGKGVCKKRDVGNAGCAFTRTALAEILASVSKTRYSLSLPSFLLPSSPSLPFTDGLLQVL